MSALVKTIKSRLTDDTIYPITKADAVYLNDNITTVEEALENKISNTGGIIIGNLRVNTNGTNSYAVVNNVPFIRGEAPSSSDAKGGFILGDQNGVEIGRLDAYFWQDGYEGIRIGTSRTVGGAVTGNYLHLGINDNGTKRVTIYDITPWCVALHLGQLTEKQAATSGSMTIATGTATAITNLALPAGSYVIQCIVPFNSKNDTTYRKVALGSGSTNADYGYTQVAASSSGNTQVVYTSIVKLTAASTVYLNATSGASGDTTVIKSGCYIRAMSVGLWP